MKNYPILSLKNDFIPYKVYNITYLEELNKLVFSLFQYSEYMIPDFKENDNVTITDDTLDLLQLNFHNYYQLKQDTDIKINDVLLEEQVPASTVIISYARAEGTVDDHTISYKKNNILDNSANYFFQPMSWGSYYIPSFSQTMDGSYYIFTYDKYAEEKYGRSLYFAFDTFYTRYFYIDNFTDPDAKKYFINGTNSEVALSARDTKNKINHIIDHQGNIWSSYLKNPVMGFVFSPVDNNDYGEEMIIDSKWEASKVERSNIAHYTIMSRENKKEWPSEDHQIFIEII